MEKYGDSPMCLPEENLQVVGRVGSTKGQWYLRITDPPVYYLPHIKLTMIDHAQCNTLLKRLFLDAAQTDVPQLVTEDQFCGTPVKEEQILNTCLLYTSPSPRD